MAVTPEDISTLTKTLSGWELAEYIFAGLVTVACLGEAIAEFTDWFTGGIEKRKKRLEKASTILLVSALALELVCLVRTNQLSAMVIGSLSNEAGEAATKAQSALTDSTTALTRSEQASRTANAAEDVSESAVNKSNGALSSATNDLAMSRGIVTALRQPTLTDAELKEFSDRVRPCANPNTRVIVVGNTLNRLVIPIWDSLKKAGFDRAEPQMTAHIWYGSHASGPLTPAEAMASGCIQTALAKTGKISIIGLLGIDPPGSPVTVWLGDEPMGNLPK